MYMTRVIAITNQKGGVGKTVTSECLGVILAKGGKRVLLIDFDPQGNLTKGLGYRDSHKYNYSLKDAILSEVNETTFNWSECIIHTNEGVDLIPSNISLSGTDLMLSNVMSRETVFKRVLEHYKHNYDYILIDSNPALNLLTINALTACDSVIVPLQAEPFATDGLADLMQTMASAKKQLNPDLKIDGVLITMTDARTNLSKHICNEVRDIYGSHVHVFKTEIPRCVKTAEASLSGESPVKYAPNAESTVAYERFTKEVLKLHEKETTKFRSKSVR